MVHIRYNSTREKYDIQKAPGQPRTALDNLASANTQATCFLITDPSQVVNRKLQDHMRDTGKVTRHLLLSGRLVYGNDDPSPTLNLSYLQALARVTYDDMVGEGGGKPIEFVRVGYNPKHHNDFHNYTDDKPLDWERCLLIFGVLKSENLGSGAEFLSPGPLMYALREQENV